MVLLYKTLFKIYTRLVLCILQIVLFCVRVGFEKHFINLIRKEYLYARI